MRTFSRLAYGALGVGVATATAARPGPWPRVIRVCAIALQSCPPRPRNPAALTRSLTSSDFLPFRASPATR